MTINLSEKTMVNRDLEFMKVALSLANRGIGNTWPNPSVGCVIVKNNIIISRGWTQPGGRPHAEVEALMRAGSASNGATAYVTLEPCDHFGETPPCSKALVKAGIKRVVISVRDRDKRVSGSGIKFLKNSGIEVIENILTNESEFLNNGFFSKIVKSRPHITLKLATSLDGKIATKTGESKWITGKISRRYGHFLRMKHDAVLIGSGTALIDNPLLTCRITGINNIRRTRIILDGQLRIGLDSQLVQTAMEAPVMIFINDTKKLNIKKIDKLLEKGISIIKSPYSSDGINLEYVMTKLIKKGITRVLIESGGNLASSCLKANLIDEIFWFRAPFIIGNDGKPAIRNLGLDSLDKIYRYDKKFSTSLGDDVLDHLLPIS
ncbi:MAG: riboflavin biosynthesis protein RibD [Rhodospirillaceae bacterium]|nr:riboflavin biosynthesis protein RibD [Rhodospirillaceae bacterium]OUT79961.1 MAG: riboflavin biosynthesis protein RibD [Rhodospirillaceae bacterium TMED23]